MTAITVAYGSRFGSTGKLAAELAVGFCSVGATAQLIDVAEKTQRNRYVAIFNAVRARL